MEIKFERRALYDEVWTFSLVQLGKKYDLSDNSIRKACKAMSIPTPTNGHWAKVAAGKPTVKPPLPPEAARTTYISRAVRIPVVAAVSEENAWLTSRIDFERLEENKIVFEPRPLRWHRVVAPRRRAIRERDGKLSPIVARALAILNTLCFAAEARGFDVVSAEKSERVLLRGFGGETGLRVCEHFRREWHMQKMFGGLHKTRVHVATGNLRAYIGDKRLEFCIADKPDRPIEGNLNELFFKVYTRIVQFKQREHELVEWRRKREEQEREEALAEQRLRKAEAAKQRELAKRDALIEDARAWQTATLIRTYIAHLQSYRVDAMNGGAHDNDWYEWATGVADDIDPMAKS